MKCLDRGNCRQGETVYYCPARDEFVIQQEPGRVRIKERRLDYAEDDKPGPSRRKRSRRERES